MAQIATAEQLKAIQYSEGPLRIIAGAGTGKTFTLVSRVEYLIKEKSIRPERILLLTFTNKAAQNLHERLSKNENPGVAVLTFHALAARLLRKFWREDFRILNSAETQEILNGILSEFERKEIKDIQIDLGILRQSHILEMKNVPKRSILSKRRLSEILETYEGILYEKNALDFDGLLIALYKFWLTDEKILAKSQNLFDHVLVDEYQDVNQLQVEILRKLVEKHRNICVVGDSDQTIYSWRGAQVSTLKDFEDTFGKCETVFLTENFRNSKEILEAAQSLIVNNQDRIPKTLHSYLTSEKVNFWENKNDYQQNEVIFYLLERYLGSVSEMAVADELDSDHANFKNLGEIAFLYRTQTEGKFLAELLSKKGYPYQVSSGEYFWQKKEIRGFVDDLINLKEAMPFPEAGKFSDFMAKLVENFSVAKELKKLPAERMQHLINYAVKFDHLDLREAYDAFLDEAKTEQEADNLLAADRINLLTLHAAKGLEFPVVFIVGLNEGMIPHGQLSEDDYFLAEERRLLYVGMTRASEHLHLFALSGNENDGHRERKRSRFLGEIGLNNMIFQKLPEKRAEKLRKKEVKKAQMSLF